MNRPSSTRTTLFLMEIVISILLLALSGTVCVQMFVRAHLIARQSIQTNLGVLWTQNLAETFQNCDGDMDAIQSVFAEYAVRLRNETDDLDDPDTLILFLDEEGQLIHHPADDLSGLMASYELLLQIYHMPAETYYGPVDTGDAALLVQRGAHVTSATIALLNVEGDQIVFDDLDDVLTEDDERVIHLIVADTPIRSEDTHNG
ncbi:MAG: hypothetical protein IJT34_03635 [Butyrivibrio sp.]|nr:hypothetical protein [Butyrivibrio sp.]